MRNKNHASPVLELSKNAQLLLIEGARSIEPVSGLTHGFYKYPARFSPAFVRAAIETFTEPADLVIDNHVGGGTTLVEATALGRHAIGIDISPLAEFVAVTKTTLFSDHELAQLDAWAKSIRSAINIHGPAKTSSSYAELGYYKHLDHPSRWRLRKAIDQGLGQALALRAPRLVAFARCVILRTAQWALDGRREPPSIEKFRESLAAYAREMLHGARDLRLAADQHSERPVVRVLNRSSAGVETDDRLKKQPPPKLIITSPPYPGVHVLYHRWQVDGGKEIPLPFMIADKLNGSGSSYYTMGDRQHPQLNTYFANIQSSMASVSKLADAETTVVQMVAFSDPSWQLNRYLQAMKSAGLQEVFLPLLQSEGDGRLWRSVPNRRWYSDQRGATPGSKEVVLFHRIARRYSSSPLCARAGASASFRAPK